MKMKAMGTWLSFCMTMSTPTASMALNIMSGHISRVDISKKVIMLNAKLLKLLIGVLHSLYFSTSTISPSFNSCVTKRPVQSAFVLMAGAVSLQKAIYPLSSCTPKIPKTSRNNMMMSSTFSRLGMD